MLAIDAEAAHAVAREFVRPLGRRWLHVCSVAASARRVADAVGLDGDVLVAASWLHDIGYSPELRDTGFHPIDGARYLRQRGWDERVVSLVAHHSCARFEASIRRLVDELGEFPRPPAEYEDALCFCDMTNGPAGEPVEASERLDEIQQRYGPGDPVTQFVGAARVEILASVARVERRLRVSGSRASGR